MLNSNGSGSAGKFLKWMHQISFVILQDIAPKNESGGEEMPAAADEATKFEFTKIESILIAFHTIGSQAPEFLTENDSALHKEFKVSA